MNNLAVKALLAATGAVLLSHAASAQTVSYAHQDLLLGLRETGNASDLVVNLGPASQFYAPGSSTPFSISGLSLTDVIGVFGDFNGVSWSVIGTVRLGDSGSVPINTLWVTTVRLDAGTQSSPPDRGSSGTQQNAGARVNSIGNNFNGANQTANSTTATIQSDITNPGSSYSFFLGANGDLQGQYQNGSVESTTPGNFATGGTKYVYEDLYQLNPGSGPGTYLGYFRIGNDASVQFTPVPEPSTVTLMGGACAGIVLLHIRNRFRQKSA